MGSPHGIREALARAREELEQAEREADEYETDDAREQRELARAEYSWRLIHERFLHQDMARMLREVAERKGEGWLFEHDVLEADDHPLREKRAR